MKVKLLNAPETRRDGITNSELVTEKLPSRVRYEQFQRESKIMVWNLSQEFGYDC
jgi:hypothetical protein